MADSYVEHVAQQIAGFELVDASSTGPRAFNDLVWVGCAGEGRWLSPDAALELARSIEQLVHVHRARRALEV